MSQSAIPLKYTYLTVAAAVTTLAVKFAAAHLTGSVGLLADAMESIVNLVTSVLLVVLIRVAQAPPDEDHPHGHDKAEYFANGVQGSLIMLAGAGIIYAAVERLRAPQSLEAGVVGIGLSVVAACINTGTARLLTAAGTASRSSALKGEAEHLMSDVWTSVAVLVGVGAVYLTGLPWLDPLIAAAVSIMILFTGAKLLKQCVMGLMDVSLPPERQSEVQAILDTYCQTHGVTYHALRSRTSGARTFISLHLLVPGHWSVSRGHDLADEIETHIGRAIGASVLTHIEPLEEPRSFEDIHLTPGAGGV